MIVKIALPIVLVLIFSCFKNVDALIFEEQIIKRQIVSENYEYNENGITNSPFGTINILTKSHYKNKKLEKVLMNKPEGFLEYSLTDFKRDTELLTYYKIDTIYSKKNMEIFSIEKQQSNDTLFFKLKNNEILMLLEK